MLRSNFVRSWSAVVISSIIPRTLAHTCSMSYTSYFLLPIKHILTPIPSTQAPTAEEHSYSLIETLLTRLRLDFLLLYFVHAGLLRTNVEILNKLVESTLIALSLANDAAIACVLHPAGDVEALGLLRCRCTVSDVSLVQRVGASEDKCRKKTPWTTPSTL